MSVLWRGSVTQKARLATGLVLFLFAGTHFLNHALGIVSLDAMNGFDDWRNTITRSLAGSVILTSALVVHAVLGLAKVTKLRTIRMPPWEALQIALGLAIPFYLLPHIVNTRIAALLGVNTTFAFELAKLWPDAIVFQSILMLLVWGHGCIGLHYWLRLLPNYRKVAPTLLALAVLVPFAAFIGFSVQGRAIQTAIQDPQGFSALQTASRWPDAALTARLLLWKTLSVDAFYGLVAVGAVVAILHYALVRRANRISVHYADGPVVNAERGATLLETSRRFGIPHLSVCGGRGRCSTCRVLILDGLDDLDPPSETERKTLRAIQAGPEVRLACQTRPRKGLKIMPLLTTAVAPELAQQHFGHHEGGIERELAVLFVDMRDFTAMTESKLAFDVVFILNRFFSTVGKPIYAYGGWIANYAGDGLIALFSDPGGIAQACRAAIMAAGEIDREIADLNGQFVRDMQQPIRIAMGLHAGPHILGRIGYKEAVSQSVVGLAVNVASRMEALAKRAGVQIAVSKIVADKAGLDTRGMRVETTDVRGLEQPIGVVLVDEARDLTSRLRPLAARS